MNPKVIERSTYGAVGFVILIAFMYAYRPQHPETVWVPGDGFEIELTVSIAESKESYKVGEWMELYAEQRSGPWIEVGYDSRPEGVQYWTSPPPEVETDVQASVRWIAEPDTTSEFNLPTTQTLDARRVRFTQPGEYSLHAEVRHPDFEKEPVKSNALTITITE